MQSDDGLGSFILQAIEYLEEENEGSKIYVAVIRDTLAGEILRERIRAARLGGEKALIRFEAEVERKLESIEDTETGISINRNLILELHRGKVENAINVLTLRLALRLRRLKARTKRAPHAIETKVLGIERERIEVILEGLRHYKRKTKKPRR